MTSLSTRLDLGFLLLSAVNLIAGVSLGLWMGVTANFAFAPVHGHINLIGWVSLALYGLAYRLYRLHEYRAAAFAHFVLAASAAILFPIGLWLELSGGSGAVIAVAAPMWWLGAVLFVVLLALRLFGPGMPAQARTGPPDGPRPR